MRININSMSVSARTSLCPSDSFFLLKQARKFIEKRFSIKNDFEAHRCHAHNFSDQLLTDLMSVFIWEDETVKDCWWLRCCCFECCWLIGFRSKTAIKNSINVFGLVFVQQQKQNFFAERIFKSWFKFKLYLRKMLGHVNINFINKKIYVMKCNI